MNIAALLGLLSAIAVVAYTVVTAVDDLKVFLDMHAFVIVLGGTITVALLSFRVTRLWHAMRIIVRKMFGGQQADYLATIKTIVETAERYRSNPQSAYDQLPAKCHPFLRDGIQMIVEYGFDVDDLDDVLSNALNGKKKRDELENKVWLTISRFPPAFGLLGATVGMIALLQTLGQEGAEDKIGPAMAVALVATFYGLVFANLVFIPISENIAEISSEDITLRKIIKEGVLLIREKKHPLFIEEYLKSFLAPKDRKKDFSSAGGGGGQKAA